MALTRIDCDFFRGKGANTGTSSFVAFNPRGRPGSLVVAGASAAKASLGGQIACKLALEHFVAGVVEYFEREPADSEEPLSQDVLEAAFKRANSSVYNFGHKLAAGGRMAANLIGVVVEDSVVAAGKVGEWSAFLYRDGELFPFFAPDDGRAAGSENFVGSKSLVKIETASVAVEAADSILLFSGLFGPEIEARIVSKARSGVLEQPDPAARLSGAVVDDCDRLALAMVARIGPDAIYLEDGL